MKYEITGTIEREVTDVFRVNKLATAVRKFTEKHNCIPDVVNGRCVAYICEACGAPIFVGQKYGYGGDSVYLHIKCAVDRKGNQ